MAQYWEDWSGSTLGEAPTGWTARTANAKTRTVIADANGPAGRALQTERPSADKLAFLSWDVLDSDPDRADFKIRILTRAPQAYSTMSALWGCGGRASGSALSSYNALFWQASPTPTAQRVMARKYTSGSGAVVAETADGAYTSGDRYWLGLEVSGTTVRATLATEADPSTLLVDISGTDSAHTAAGWIGLVDYNHGTGDAPLVYAVGVGTNGDEAPLSAPTAGDLAGAATASGSASGDLSTGIALAGDATAAAAVAGELTTGVPTKGVRVRLSDRDGAVRASVTGITATWWDDSGGQGAYVFQSTTAETDSSGWLELDLNAVTALALGGVGHLKLFKAGATPADDWHASLRVAIENIQ